MREKNELLPCPHCPESIVDTVEGEISRRWQVMCGACGSSSGSCKTKVEAVALWNRRTGVVDAPFTAAQIREALEWASLEEEPHNVRSTFWMRLTGENEQ